MKHRAGILRNLLNTVGKTARFGGTVDAKLHLRAAWVGRMRQEQTHK